MNLTITKELRENKMCGILALTSDQEITQLISPLKKALGALEHRGPDDISFSINDHVFLGHVRLAVVGLDAASNQPYSYEDLTLIYNGEIFNYIEIREQLQKIGYSFETNSDTEVVLKAFHCFGTDCFNSFNGMWALVIYDKKSGEVIVSRDRFGQKPLFYSVVNGKLFFASELHAIASLNKFNPNYRAIKSFLQEGDFDVDGETFFDGIFEFPNAHFMRCKGSKIIICQQYWSYPEKCEESSFEDDSFHQLLNDAVEIRLRTDVKYCLLLSGGLDSTLIAGITHRLVGAKMRIAAFTYSSKDKDDEVAYANEVARDLNLDLNINSTPPDAQDYLNYLKNLVKLLGRGHSSPAIVSSSILYKAVSEQGFKVALDGQGADELLAGYKHYHFHLILECLKRRLFSQIIPLLKDLRAEGIKHIVIMALRNTLPSWGRRTLRMLYGYESIFKAENLLKAKKNPFVSNLHPPKSYGIFDKYLFKQHTVGLKNLLYYGDIVSMASSVENRSPFMDHRLVELSFQAGPLLKVRYSKNKAVLRSHPVYTRFQHILDRKKVGFNSPIDWHIKKQMLEELRDSKILHWQIFNSSKIREYLSDDRLISKKYERFLFRLIQVHLWAVIFTADTPLPRVADA